MSFILKPVSPFDLDLSARILSEGDERIRRYDGRDLRQVIRVGGRPILTTLRSLGLVEEPELSLDLAAEGPISEGEASEAERIITYLLSLDLDLHPFYRAVAGDRVMARLAQILRGMRNPSTQTVFEALVDSIVEQQISIKVAWVLERRLTVAFGDLISIGDVAYYAFPTPERLAASTIDDLRSCGLSSRKAEYILGASKLSSGSLDLEKFKGYDDPDKIIEELCQIRGIGIWTAELTMVRGMRMLDAMPADDLGLRRCISHYYCGDRKITSSEARRIGEKWLGWRGLASFYLLMAERLGVEV